MLSEEKNLFVRIIEPFLKGCLSQITRTFALRRVTVRDDLITIP